MRRKMVFDAVRRMLGRGFSRVEVERLDQAIDAAFGNAGEPCPARTVSPAGVALIKKFEGCARLRGDGLYEAYPDPGTGGAPWTIGWGATGRGIERGTVWTAAQCEARLASDIARHAAEVDAAIGTSETSQGQFDALVSFHFNTGAIARATLTRRHRAGDYAGAAREFGRWNRAAGRVLAGLTRRRAAEAALYERQ